jgi:hypothetical protein
MYNLTLEASMDNPRISVRSFRNSGMDRDTFFYDAAEALRFARSEAAQGRSVAVGSNARNWLTCVGGVWRVRFWSDFYLDEPSTEYQLIHAAWREAHTPVG